MIDARTVTIEVMRRMSAAGHFVDYQSWLNNGGCAATFTYFCSIGVSVNFRRDWGINLDWQVFSPTARRIIGDIYLFTSYPDSMRRTLAAAELLKVGEIWPEEDLGVIAYGLFATISPARKAIGLSNAVEKFVAWNLNGNN